MSVTASILSNAELPIARYRFSARLRQPLNLPDYAGSLLRGQFGAALRQLSCMTRQPTCDGCPLQYTCPYIRIFEARPPSKHKLQTFSAIPNAYIVEPPPPLTQRLPNGARHPAQQEADDILQFHMVLVGDALEQLPLVIYAWQRALQHGLTRSRSQADLFQVEWLDSRGQAYIVWSAEDPQISAHPACLRMSACADARTIQLQIHTPLRLQQQGRPLSPEQLSPRALIAAICRRVALMLEFHAGQPAWGTLVPSAIAMAPLLRDERKLRWFDWVRYSSRQRQEMALGGVIGQWNLEGDPKILAELWPWLWLGQWLHVGKNATFGLGGYKLQLPHDHVQTHHTTLQETA